MKILHIDCSPRPEAWSRRLSALVLQRLLSRHEGAEIVRRDLGVEPVAHPESDYATALSNRTNYMAALSGTALHLSEALIRELEAADLVVIGTPMNNFTLPSSLKAWLDQVIRMGRTVGSSPAGKVGLLADRPVLVAVSSGNIFDGEHANQPDFLRPYLTAALEVMGLKTVRYFPLQATAHREETALWNGIEEMGPAIDSAIGDIDPPPSKAA